MYPYKSVELDAHKLYRRVHQDELVHAKDLVREYNPDPVTSSIPEFDPHRWYTIYQAVPLLIGRPQKNVPTLANKFEIVREVTYEELELLLKHKEEDRNKWVSD